MKALSIASVVGGALALTACGTVNVNTDEDPALQEALDRLAIREMLVSYYSHFGGSENEDFASYYTDDAVFDVNGIVSTGHEEIVALYDGMGDDDAPADANLAAAGTFHMLATNIEVQVEGDVARARLYWTGVLNTDPFGPPHLQEHGREYDLFERQEDGSWLIAHRVVIADSAMPEMFRASYEPRLDFSWDDLGQ